MELKEGMYVRTRYGDIGKLISTSIFDVSPNQTDYWFDADVYVSFYGKGAMICGEHIELEIIKASHNIIDLIEVGDYVNGVLVESIYSREEDKMYFHTFETEIMIEVTKENINNIVTKEQFESMSYKVEE